MNCDGKRQRRGRLDAVGATKGGGCQNGSCTTKGEDEELTEVKSSGKDATKISGDEDRLR